MITSILTDHITSAFPALTITRRRHLDLSERATVAMEATSRRLMIATEQGVWFAAQRHGNPVLRGRPHNNWKTAFTWLDLAGEMWDDGLWYTPAFPV